MYPMASHDLKCLVRQLITYQESLIIRRGVSGSEALMTQSTTAIFSDVVGLVLSKNTDCGVSGVVRSKPYPSAGLLCSVILFDAQSVCVHSDSFSSWGCSKPSVGWESTFYLVINKNSEVFVYSVVFWNRQIEKNLLVV